MTSRPNDFISSLANRYNAGESLNDIAIDVGMDRETLRRRLVNLGVTMRTRGWPKGMNRSEHERRSNIVAVPDPVRLFCDQCDRLVRPDEARNCGSQFCKVAA